jgi:inhibitor of KinA
MPAPFSYSFFPLGDSALLIDFGNKIDREINAEVLRIFQTLRRKQLPFITNLVPAYASLTIHYHAGLLWALCKEGQTAYDVAVEQIEMLLKDAPAIKAEGRFMRIPVCYEEAFAPDIFMIAERQQLSLSQVVALHTAVTYHVYMLGFLPGFAYMGEVNDCIATPRLQQPRKEVAAGSVGIAGRQTGIYSLASPGGWNIIGRTPLRLFDAHAEQPVLLQPGDTVQFYSITADEFAHYQNRTA